MDARARAELAQALRRRRAVLLKQFFDAEADLRSIAEDREPELEERAQEERAASVLAGLDDRSLREIGEIHAALQRIIDGTYGKCRDCSRTIPVARLRAVPTTIVCVECARDEEVPGLAGNEERLDRLAADRPPAATPGRRETTMPILKKLKEFLDTNRVRYEVRSHRTAYTAQEVAAAEHVPGREMAKVVMVRDGGKYLMAVLPAPYHVGLEQLARATGRTGLRLATEGEFAGLFPGCEPGAMPPFGNLYGIPVWVDEALTRDDEIAFNAGNHEQTVHMKYADFARLVEPRMASLRAGSRAA